MAVMYTCGLLTGFMVAVWRKKPHTLSASGDLSAPTYEEVSLPPTVIQTAISLKENTAYGHVIS